VSKLDVRIGINPISWSNDDLPSLGGEIPLEVALREGRQIGYQGFELGNKFPREPKALRDVLHGSDRASRGFAASGLAELKAKDSVPDLFAVLAKDVPEAAGAIGELCTGAECGKFTDLLGRLPFDLMQTGLGPILLRPESEVPPEFKLELLERLRKLQTDEARNFSSTIQASYPEKGHAWVKYGLEQAVGNKPVVMPAGPNAKAKGQ
jgi:hypothetical protein